MVGETSTGMLERRCSMDSFFFFFFLSVGCANLQAMYLNRCRFVDDWFLARLAHEFHDQLLFLDLSGCPSVGVTGILALTKLKYVFSSLFFFLSSDSIRSLKKLRLHDLPPFDGKELATMIFEENVPGCLVEGVEYETAKISGLLEAGPIEPVTKQEEIERDTLHMKRIITTDDSPTSIQTNESIRQ